MGRSVVALVVAALAFPSLAGSAPPLSNTSAPGPSLAAPPAPSPDGGAPTSPGPASPTPSAAPTPPPGPPAAPPAIPTVPFSGVVREAGERTPLPAIDVIIPLADGEPLSTLTDDEGRFSFPAVPIGKRRVSVRGSGFVPADTDEEFSAGKSRQSIYYLRVKQRYSTTVRGARLVKQTIEQTLQIEEIKRIPGTQGDALKSIQTLPGVARAPFGLGNLIVWGSAPQDTRAYVNGVYIPTLYHFGGLRSTVNSDLVASLDFTAGGYGTDYGRGMGGIVQINTRRPKGTGIHGSLDLNLIDGAVRIEGAPSKNVSLYASARRSWIDGVLRLFQTNAFQLSPTYWDYQAAVFWKAAPRDDLEFVLFGSDDTTQLLLRNPDPLLSGQFNLHSFYHRLLVRWTHRFGNGAVLTVTPSIGYDQPTAISASFGNISFSATSTGIPYALKIIARLPLAKFLRLDAGLDFEGRRGDIEIIAPFGTVGGGGGGGGPPAFGQYTRDATAIHLVQVAPYASANFTFFDGRLQVNPGLRVELAWYGGYLGTPDAFGYLYPLLEPRLQARYQFNKYFAVKGAIGAYHQPPQSANLLRLFGNPQLRPQEAYHYVAGFEIDPTATLHFEMSGFYKELRALVISAAPSGKIYDNGGLGRVFGGELLLRQKLFHKFFGWVSYTLSRAERRDRPGEAWRLFDFDQTHILSLIASYELPYGFQVGLRFRYVTGNPTTVPETFYYDARADVYRRVNSLRNNDRLDDFHQLDLRIDKVFTYRLWKFAIYLDIQNLYNRANPEGIQYADRPLDCAALIECRAPIAGLPIFPALGISGEY